MLFPLPNACLSTENSEEPPNYTQLHLTTCERRRENPVRGRFEIPEENWHESGLRGDLDLPRGHWNALKLLEAQKWKKEEGFWGTFQENGP